MIKSTDYKTKLGYQNIKLVIMWNKKILPAVLLTGIELRW